MTILVFDLNSNLNKNVFESGCFITFPKQHETPAKS